MNFQGAVITEQGVTFAVLVVKSHVLHDVNAQANMRQLGVRAWGRMPVVLMTQDASGRATYNGRPDLVKFLANLDLRQIPWRNWSIAA